MRTTTKWIKEQEFESRQEHHSLRLDGTRKHGVSPKAVLLSGLAACSGIDVVEILQKMRVAFSSLEIETQATMTEDIPKIFKDIGPFEAVNHVELLSDKDDPALHAAARALDDTIN